MKDGFGRRVTYLRLSVTERCNLRCRYCMPAEGICKKRHEDMMTEEETIRAVRAAASLGISKVRITGGEPLVKKNILSICENTAAVPGIRQVCMTTNGTLLAGMAGPLKEAGVARLNLSLDTLDRERYRSMTRVGSLDDALEGLEAALSAGFEQVKINAVLIGGFNDEEIPALAALTKDYPADVRFIELMPMGTEFGETAYLPCDTVLERLPELRPEEPDGGVARLYRLPGAKGRVGLISPVSSHFCGSCSRLRLTADGKVKPCLHSPAEYGIRGLDEEGMRQVMLQAIQAKPRQHDPLWEGQGSRAGRTMNQIGG